MTRKKITPEIAQMCKKLYETGVPISKIAKVYGFSDTPIGTLKKFDWNLDAYHEYCRNTMKKYTGRKFTGIADSEPVTLEKFSQEEAKKTDFVEGSLLAAIDEKLQMIFDLLIKFLK